ncbi:TetR/AcrR family transcriptional regulator [Streptomyces piniterrae]|uniref:TetR/AcrR family transcriptional regulator n=1 Tax=Streptomyces piniterrae TaxID=2571125 RepID=A0A4U0NDX2_9ACTN|nr:TetR/AcrR family transcriptional regulator [Streptomyces piniterrae]
MVKAAALEFDRAGYDGTSLARISAAAGMSIGAVTFHFPSKRELADAVREQGRSVTLAALENLATDPLPALGRVVDLTLELARLMEQEPSVRSTIRLGRDHPGMGSWSDVWLPTVRKLLDRAQENGQLREDAPLSDVITLVEYLTSGSEAYLRSRIGSEVAFESAVAQLNRVWRLALAGVSADGPAGRRKAPCPLEPEGS